MSIVNLFVSAGRAFSEWRRRERAYAELMALDDRCLADIGIRREQIRALVEGKESRERPPAKSVPVRGDAGFGRRKAA
jgi:uncharacterized protein YjiS (DUF1127 family)